MSMPAARIQVDTVFNIHMHTPGTPLFGLPPDPPPPSPPICLSHPVTGITTALARAVFNLMFGKPPYSVFINGIPAAQCGDGGFHILCCGANTYEIALGSSSVNIEGDRAARMLDTTAHCSMIKMPKPPDFPKGPPKKPIIPAVPIYPGEIASPGMITMGSPTVFIGGFPMPSFTALAMKTLFKGLGLVLKGLGKLAKLAKTKLQTKLGKAIEVPAIKAPEGPTPRLEAPTAAPAAPHAFVEPGALAANAKNIPPTPGFNDLVIHGSADSFHVLHNGKWVKLDQRRVANYLKSIDFPKGDIRIVSCGTGANPNAIAQDLSNKLGVKVKAPSDTVWVFPNGRMTIGATENANTGKWDVFAPRPSPKRVPASPSSATSAASPPTSTVKPSSSAASAAPSGGGDYPWGSGGRWETGGAPLTQRQVERAVSTLRNGGNVRVSNLKQLRQIQAELGQVGARPEGSSGIIPQRRTVDSNPPGTESRGSGTGQDGHGTFRVDPPHGAGTSPRHPLHEDHVHINITLPDGKTADIVMRPGPLSLNGID